MQSFTGNQSLYVNVDTQALKHVSTITKPEKKYAFVYIFNGFLAECVRAFLMTL